MLMVWHWVPDDADPWGLIGEYRDALAPGSFLALTHLTADLRESMTDAPRLISTSRSVDQLTGRSYDKVLNLFGDFQLVDPGLVSCAQWRPGSSNDTSKRRRQKCHHLRRSGPEDLSRSTVSQAFLAH
jgi:hypothetical protein